MIYIMNEAIVGIIIGIIIIAVLWPYFSLCDLNHLSGIEDELRGIKKELEKLNEGIRKRN